ncbi:cysteine--1-D-myo-inosityl 2-amino-2-deoxy-alpha-D-glucopyranoside ligase [Cellulomonas bogoriensis]|uniref:L-cysteine:1D-myo-inositol 2-amino-2-deoxy-alpha-D-glucopyranoside ligase n=1 Tax=Cellulomonas bogoriensis 69B4 = DSM 16987 TaxID=1386082 RepID=A0A0A0C2Z4_9CELL|nr:cysteine--1-D-myo-inosityl 2-amino-2-deoxy-alpha-D-glucopyranoside ligase [Cellulomonas bogoriensis]KGM14367.1 L-cysteine:1D-myo-inositol 2-amino-2-deoxy-alpha-D-glucopyranoside ligase [Cellulomonas bogoriensis 69B4 = DSM 16987]
MRTWPSPQIPQVPGRGGEVHVLDSATGRLVPAASGPVGRMYVCGITPYDATHIGHAATYIAFDLLHRAWLDSGLLVEHASNVTDVDDPLLERAQQTGVRWEDLAADQSALFAEDMTALGVIPPHTYLGAVETIPLVVEAVSGMVHRGQAYRVPAEDGTGGGDATSGDVYADLAAVPDAPPISDLDREQSLALFSERGGDPDRPGKRDALDPALWRSERPGEPSWDGGPLGPGRPGWHVECTVIARHSLGDQVDVQGGGRDLLFPHHQMSTAHSVALGAHAPRVHVHAGMVGLDGEKMSKSKGNLVLVSALRDAGVDPMAVRLAVLAHHYRSDWEWTDGVLDQARDRLTRWRTALSGNGGPDAGTTVEAVRAALTDDLDAPAALAAVDTWVDAALSIGGEVEGAPGVMARAIDALLGVRM